MPGTGGASSFKLRFKLQASSVKQRATNRKEKMLEIFIIFTSLFILNMLGVFTVTI
jgi:hypothetical protein